MTLRYILYVSDMSSSQTVQWGKGERPLIKHDYEQEMYSSLAK